jgi:hypothetical protein
MCGSDFLHEEPEELPAAAVQEMIENALRMAVARFLGKGVEPTVAFIREGPYAIPALRGTEGPSR